MAKSSSVAILLLTFTSALAWSVVLDKSSDITDTMWKIKGYSMYLEDGNALRGPIHQYLPDEFQYPKFALSKGIWAIVPSKNDCDVFQTDSFENFSSEEDTDSGMNSNFSSTSTPRSTPLCNTSASASFQCKTSAQLMASVKVRYNFGGNATLRITGARGHPYEEFAEGKQMDDWVETSVPLDGRQMTVEAIVNQDGAYVLIDSITVEIGGASTTPRTTTTTTTEKPQPPTSGQQMLLTYSVGFLTVLALGICKMI
ncbi:hypothetical protein Ocin01_04833 [Orchesella cincta]|uniref:Uncharacterized protein n=1 Tax=Orchesella cincta TaxID=48709 RepID=A0A1D2N9A9_ORCCI|nr:hypothetical protein Ocin01_04833 [Orchesella cincta]